MKNKEFLKVGIVNGFLSMLYFSIVLFAFS